MTRKMRFQFVAIAGSGLLAATTMLGAVALQGSHQDGDRTAANAAAPPPADAPIVYAGGFGLFPVAE